MNGTGPAFDGPGRRRLECRRATFASQRARPRRAKKLNTRKSTDILFVAEPHDDHGAKTADRVRPLALSKTLRERAIVSGDGPRVNDDPDVQGGMR
jgi:hypothetical protein